MRKRSYTVYATSVEDLTAILSSASSTNPQPSTRKTPARSGPKRKASAGEDLWKDFDYSTPTALSDTVPTLQRKRSRLCSTTGLDNDTDTCPVIPRRLIVKKIMVMGLRGAGKHFLVNSAFHSQGEQDLIPLKQSMDFILKTEAVGDSETKYHFWIRELNDHKFESVVKVYYKMVTMFVFVYSVTDRSSFEALDEAITAVLKEVPREKFTGVLLANRSDSTKNCEVSHAEGVELKEKHKLALFMDTGDGEVKEKLVELLKC